MIHFIQVMGAACIIAFVMHMATTIGGEKDEE